MTLQWLYLLLNYSEKQTDEIYLAHDLLDFKSDIQKAILNCVKSTVVCKTPEIACHVASGKIFDEAVNVMEKCLQDLMKLIMLQGIEI